MMVPFADIKITGRETDLRCREKRNTLNMFNVKYQYSVRVEIVGRKLEIWVEHQERDPSLSFYKFCLDIIYTVHLVFHNQTG